MVNGYLEGKKYELKLAKILFKHGFFVMRAPASGRGAINLPYVDLVAIKKGKVLLFEVKKIDKPHNVYIRREQFEKLKKAEKLANGKAFIAIYIEALRKWTFIPIDKVNKFTPRYVKLNIHDLAEGLKLRDIVKLKV